MKYELTDFQGNTLSINEAQAKEVAQDAELIGIKVNGRVHYMNKKNIAKVSPTSEPDVEPHYLIDRPDFRGRPSPAKEKLRKKFGPDVKGIL